MLEITNPADGSRIREIDSDNEKTIKEKYTLARTALPSWVAVPLRSRLEVIDKFKKAVEQKKGELARTLTSETGKPITQSRNELNALAARLDFFLEKTKAALAPEAVLNEPKMREEITH